MKLEDIFAELRTEFMKSVVGKQIELHEFSEISKKITQLEEDINKFLTK